MGDKKAVSPINGQPLPRGRPFNSETAKAARQKRTAKSAAAASIAEEFKRLVLEYQTDKNGKQIIGAELIARSIMKSCITGNVRAQELALALMGEKPAENINITAADFSALDAAFDRMAGDEG